MKTVIVQGINADVRTVRTEVFMEEQGFQNEFDETDQSAFHVIVYDGDDPLAVCRVFQEGNDYILGRLAVRKKYRGLGLGALVLTEAEKHVLSLGGNCIKLHAQCRVTDFYRKSGYREYGEVEDDEGFLISG